MPLRLADWLVRACRQSPRTRRGHVRPGLAIHTHPPLLLDAVARRCVWAGIGDIPGRGIAFHGPRAQTNNLAASEAPGDTRGRSRPIARLYSPQASWRR